MLPAFTTCSPRFRPVILIKPQSELPIVLFLHKIQSHFSRFLAPDRDIDLEYAYVPCGVDKHLSVFIVMTGMTLALCDTFENRIGCFCVDDLFLKRNDCFTVPCTDSIDSENNCRNNSFEKQSFHKSLEPLKPCYADIDVSWFISPVFVYFNWVFHKCCFN